MEKLNGGWSLLLASFQISIITISYDFKEIRKGVTPISSAYWEIACHLALWSSMPLSIFLLLFSRALWTWTELLREWLVSGNGGQDFHLWWSTPLSSFLEGVSSTWLWHFAHKSWSLKTTIPALSWSIKTTIPACHEASATMKILHLHDLTSTMTMLHHMGTNLQRNNKLAACTICSSFNTNISVFCWHINIYAI